MKILHFGATGLVGQHVLERLLAEPRVAGVVAPTRRTLVLRDQRLCNPVIDFERMPADAPWWGSDAVICTLGSTLRQAGSRDAFARIDHGYPLQVARLARANGADCFVLNSAAGASSASPFFYNRVKGRLEEDLATLGFPSLVLVRPGLIDGHRREHRPAEAWALRGARLLRPLLPRSWRPSRAGEIAEALVDAALQAPRGITRIGPEVLA